MRGKKQHEEGEKTFLERKSVKRQYFSLSCNLFPFSSPFLCCVVGQLEYDVGFITLLIPGWCEGRMWYIKFINVKV